ncbi:MULTISPECIES: hypothetical protein [Ureibacillus]|uniref:Core-binding (CB) domain-containing protein n=3 Tax=Ureibacillus TaxID=160795 RepID=A0A0A3IS10_9BACL|nr:MULTISPECIES: hypothetical protein [Ureibacillus]KGR86235.1 hypothetical protein CD30_19035 [Ureibacillus massiliensis 4400831 = CIP 108448 = CCUG 49529]MCM3390693.1 hypothetical protein [Ureibacillus chungkukjangi]PYF01851.1 hypothetical protein BJ095_1552 [Ureibacillus chungkukjangi]
MILNKTSEQQALALSYEKVMQELSGYWKNDQWDPLDCPLYKKGAKIKKQSIKFKDTLNPRIKNELKYYFFKRLTNSEINMVTVWSNSSAINRLQDFILRFYSDIGSILDIPYEKFSIHYKTYLLEHGKSNFTVKGYLQLYNRIYSFFLDWYDQRQETEKDIWDVRKLDIDYNNSSYSYVINFTSIPMPFRNLAKRYIQKRVLIQESLSWGSAIQTMAKLQEFFKYIYKLFIAK